MNDSVLPFDFRLGDDTGEPVLVLGGAMDLTLEIWNTSPTALFLNPLAGQHHFTLRFRAGVLRHKHGRIHVAKAAEKDWDVSTTEEAHGDIVVHLRHREAKTWLPDDSPANGVKKHALRVKLKGLRGARAGHTRSARIELTYDHIRYGGKEGQLLTGRKYQQLLLATAMQPHPALEAHFVGDTGNVVLNDGQLHEDYRVRLRLTNTTEDVLTVTHDTKFELTLAAGDKSVPGTLATREQLGGMEVTAHGGGAPLAVMPPGPTDPDAVWSFGKPENQAGDIAVTPAGCLEVEFGQIQTGHPNGPSIVRVHWSNLGHAQGTLDGEVVATLQKSPLVIVGNRVGIGRIPRMQIDSKLVEKVKTEAAYALRGIVGSTAGGVSYHTASFPPCLDWPCIGWKQNTQVFWPGAGMVELPDWFDRVVEKPLRDLLKEWQGLQPYLDHLDKTGWSISNRSLPLLPNKSLYARIHPDGPFFDLRLFFDGGPDQSWWRTDAVFLARWDEAGVTLVDGSVHPCPVQEP